MWHIVVDWSVLVDTACLYFSVEVKMRGNGFLMKSRCTSIKLWEQRPRSEKGGGLIWLGAIPAIQDGEFNWRLSRTAIRGKAACYFYAPPFTHHFSNQSHSLKAPVSIMHIVFFFLFLIFHTNSDGNVLFTHFQLSHKDEEMQIMSMPGQKSWCIDKSSAANTHSLNKS